MAPAEPFARDTGGQCSASAKSKRQRPLLSDFPVPARVPHADLGPRGPGGDSPGASESVASSPPPLVARVGRTCDETSTRRCDRGLSRGRGPDGVGGGASRPEPWGKNSPRAWTVAGSSCGPRGSRLGAKIELSVSAFPDRRRARGSVVRGSAARRRGPPSDPAGSTGAWRRATSPPRAASPARATRTLDCLSIHDPRFSFSDPKIFFRATGQKSPSSTKTR